LGGKDYWAIIGPGFLTYFLASAVGAYLTFFSAACSLDEFFAGKEQQLALLDSVFIQVLLWDVIFGKFAGAHFSLIGVVGVLNASDRASLDDVPFF